MINRRKSLKRTLSVFGLAVTAAFATAALAASAASALSYERSDGKFPASHNLDSKNLVTWNNSKDPSFYGTCSGYKAVSGQQGPTLSGVAIFETGTSGRAQLQFEDCKHPYYNTCTSSGMPAGTIKTSILNMKPVYLDAAKTQFGLLLSPASGSVFASMTCNFGIFKSTWNGSLIVPIKSPALNVSASNFQLTFDGPHQIEGAGGEYKLYENGGFQPVELRVSSLNMSAPGFTGKFIP